MIDDMEKLLYVYGHRYDFYITAYPSISCFSAGRLRTSDIRSMRSLTGGYFLSLAIRQPLYNFLCLPWLLRII